MWFVVKIWDLHIKHLSLTTYHLTKWPFVIYLFLPYLWLLTIFHPTFPTYHWTDTTYQSHGQGNCWDKSWSFVDKTMFIIILCQLSNKKTWEQALYRRIKKNFFHVPLGYSKQNPNCMLHSQIVASWNVEHSRSVSLWLEDNYLTVKNT